MCTATFDREAVPDCVVFGRLAGSSMQECRLLGTESGTDCWKFASAQKVARATARWKIRGARHDWVEAPPEREISGGGIFLRVWGVSHLDTRIRRSCAHGRTDSRVLKLRPYHHHHTLVFTQGSHFFRDSVMDTSWQAVTGAQRRRQRRLRSWWRHVQQSIAAALATVMHHSSSKVHTARGAPRSQTTTTRAKEVEAHETHEALRRQQEPPQASSRSLDRRGATAACGTPQGGWHQSSRRRRSQMPLLKVPTLPRSHSSQPARWKTGGRRRRRRRSGNRRRR